MALKDYDVKIDTSVHYIPEESDEERGHYVFAYTITITNDAPVDIQLVSRHWVITDANQQMQEVRGLGVVGEQPLLKPGESFRYTSGTAIATPVGTMHGEYQMVAESGEHFDVSIPEFVLSMPRVLH